MPPPSGEGVAAQGSVEMRHFPRGVLELPPSGKEKIPASRPGACTTSHSRCRADPDGTRHCDTQQSLFVLTFGCCPHLETKHVKCEDARVLGRGAPALHINSSSRFALTRKMWPGRQRREPHELKGAASEEWEMVACSTERFALPRCRLIG